MTLTLHPKPFANTLQAWHTTSADGEDLVVIQPMPAGAYLTTEEATKLAKYLAPHLVDPADIPVAEVDRTSADDEDEDDLDDDATPTAP